MINTNKPKRCRICKVKTDVDSSGRCPSCACVAKAEAWGMHYGDYMAMRYCSPECYEQVKNRGCTEAHRKARERDGITV